MSISFTTSATSSDYFNSSKARPEVRQSSLGVSTPPSQQSQTPVGQGHPDHPPLFETDTSAGDSISDLLFRLNRAVANLSPLRTAEESSTIEPPRYENIT